jgi:hypothetical protein
MYTYPYAIQPSAIFQVCVCRNVLLVIDCMTRGAWLTQLKAFASVEGFQWLSSRRVATEVARPVIETGCFLSQRDVDGTLSFDLAKRIPVASLTSITWRGEATLLISLGIYGPQPTDGLTETLLIFHG